MRECDCSGHLLLQQGLPKQLLLVPTAGTAVATGSLSLSTYLLLGVLDPTKLNPGPRYRELGEVGLVYCGGGSGRSC